MTRPTPHGQVPEALEDFEVRKLAAIGAVSTSSGLVERRPIEYRRELEDQFVRGFRAAEKRLSAPKAAPVTQQAGYAEVIECGNSYAKVKLKGEAFGSTKVGDIFYTAPKQESASTIRVGWGRDYQDSGRPVDASAAPMPDFAAILQQQVRVEFDYKLGSWMALDADEQQRIVDSIRGLYTTHQPAPAPLSDDVVKDAARFRDFYRMTALLGTPAGNAYQDAMESEMAIAFKEAGSDLTKISIEQYRRVIDAGFAAATLAAQGGKV